MPISIAVGLEDLCRSLPTELPYFITNITALLKDPPGLVCVALCRCFGKKC